MDALRGVAILLVIGHHQQLPTTSAGLFYPLAGLWMRVGWTGVDLFFVLSGFLIGGLLLKETIAFGNLHAIRFLLRRGLRIWPNYYLFLIWVTIDDLWLKSPASQPAALWSRLWPCLANIQNYSRLARQHLWSLAVEEHFYLLLPFILLLFAPRPALLARRRVLAVLGTVLLACLTLRIFTVDIPPEYENRFYTHVRMDGLVFGFALAYIFHVWKDLWLALGRRRTLLALCGLAVIAPTLFLPYGNHFIGTFVFSLLYLGYGAILVASLSDSAGPNWLDRFFQARLGSALALIGFSSYSIYLWHVDLAIYATQAFSALVPFRQPELRWLIISSAAILAAIFGGILIDHCIEVPVLRLRDRIFLPRLATSPLTSANASTGVSLAATATN